MESFTLFSARVTLQFSKKELKFKPFINYMHAYVPDAAKQHRTRRHELDSNATVTEQKTVYGSKVLVYFRKH